MANDDPSVISFRDKDVDVHPNSRDVVNTFIGRLQEIEKDYIEGVYLTGSISQNDFHISKSDIDFVILCRELPDEQMQKHLFSAHRSIEKSFPDTALNGWYITRESLKLSSYQNSPALLFEKGSLTIQHENISPVTLYELHKYGVSVFGVPASELPIVISNKSLNDFLFRNINSYWADWVERHSKGTQGKILLILFPRLTEWVILGVARQYYTLKTGLITSKTKAGQYVLQHLPKEYHEILREAVQIRNDNNRKMLTFKKSYSVNPSLKRYRKTIACARYIINQFNEDYKTLNTHD